MVASCPSEDSPPTNATILPSAEREKTLAALWSREYPTIDWRVDPGSSTLSRNISLTPAVRHSKTIVRPSGSHAGSVELVLSQQPALFAGAGAMTSRLTKATKQQAPAFTAAS
jgi:hypothetical protein